MCARERKVRTPQMMIVIAHGCGCDSEREHARARTIEAEQRLYSTLEIFVRGIRCFLCSKCIPTMLARGCGGNREGKTGVSVSVFLCVYSVVGQSIVLGGGRRDKSQPRYWQQILRRAGAQCQCSSLCGDSVVRVSTQKNKSKKQKEPHNARHCVAIRW